MPATMGQIGLLLRGSLPMERVIETVTQSPAFHAFIVVSDTECVSADIEGVRLRRLSDWADPVYSRIGLTDAQAQGIAKEALKRIGRPYSWSDDILVGIQYLTGLRWPRIVRGYMNRDSEYMCSQLVATAYAEGAGLHPISRKTPGETSPGDLYDFFHAQGWV